MPISSFFPAIKKSHVLVARPVLSKPEAAERTILGGDKKAVVTDLVTRMWPVFLASSILGSGAPFKRGDCLSIFFFFHLFQELIIAPSFFLAFLLVFAMAGFVKEDR